MPTEKRQRQDQGRQSRLEQQREAAKRRQRTRGIRTLVIIVVALVAGSAIYSVVSDDGGDEGVTSDTTSTTTDGSSTTAGEPVEVTYPGPGAAISGQTPCPEVDGSSGRTTSFEKPPPMCIDPAKTYRATIATSEGDVVIQLDAAVAPIAVNNFVVLSRYHFYDGVPFHRIIPGFVDQAGTPVNQSSADFATTPGYTITDELPDVAGLASPAEAYPEGALATANRGPNTASSQWFIVVGAGGQQFATNATYSVFGHVVEGIDVVRTINRFGDAATNGTPTKAITISSVSVSEG